MRTLKLTLILIIASLTMSLTAQSVKVNTMKSKLTWVGKKVTGEHTGTIMLKSGEIILNGKEIAGGTFVFDMKTIKVTDLEGDMKKQLEGHLESDDFFSVANHPKAKFVIKGVEKIKGNEYKIKGNLTIKGITKPVIFKSMVKVKGKMVMVKGSAIVDRTKYDIKYGSGSFFKGLGDKVINDEFALSFEIVTE
ncbi:MAG: YceI family protein [Bacteroidales bacterium]|jgi:polyisoprenoid-binding protein YceI|nr:YceI family protein [Bacteroidales bacterium]